MEWEPPSPGLPLWVKFAEWGFYGFKPTICALCCLKTHDISECPKREYCPGFVQEHTNMINDSKRNWNNPYSEFYTPSLQKHLELYFEQSKMPQELWESTELYIEITNEGFQIQALSCRKSFEDQDEIGAEIVEQSACPRPREETDLDDSEISPEPALTEVHMGPMPNQEAAKKPSKLPEVIIMDVLQGVVHTKSESGNSHDSAHTQPIKFKANLRRSIQQATFYNRKKNKPNSSPIFRQDIRPEFLPVDAGVLDACPWICEALGVGTFPY